ncbi:hypothetical protein TARUN_6647 [Trichoderma arundinaceum]|uniref:Uncharacterized protein n=1 Tax=Trichoderma arundinaceum TaxID=490622 RepID=A0A395NIA7_TRIAR|nr:hypothetical protein TARUN_6647 [Trichoderma arundinaceum]
MARPVVWINAFPGTGKLTIAREFALVHKPSILIDNHQLIDPVAARLSRDHPQYQTERRRERERAFNRYVLDPASLSKTVIFTDFQTDNELGQATAQEYWQAAQKAGRPFVPIYLSCDVEANIERATSSERTQGTTTKLTDASIIRDLLSRCKIFQFDNSPYEKCHIDTTYSTPTDVAVRIRAYIEECLSAKASLNDEGIHHASQKSSLSDQILQEACTSNMGKISANGCLVYSLETGGFSSSFVPGAPTTVGQDRLRIKYGEQYELQSLTDDNVSAINVVANFTESNFSLNTTFQPRGSLLFNGGSGSFYWGSFFNNGWASPTSYITGTFNINGTTHVVDPKRSTTWYDRQWGEGTPTKGWHWVPIQLENGIRISTWVLPTEEGALKAFATVLYPNGHQEVVSVNPDIKPSDSWVSPNTNRTWFGSFEVSFLDEYNSVIRAVSPDVNTRKFGEASFGASSAFCDSFALYSGTWKGESVRGWGLVEQWPAS